MAFDHAADIFALEADMDPLGAVLLAGAAYCLEHREREWWDVDAIPFESAFSKVEGFGQTNTGTPRCKSGETACWLLLLMREAVRGA